MQCFDMAKVALNSFGIVVFAQEIIDRLVRIAGSLESKHMDQLTCARKSGQQGKPFEIEVDEIA